MFHTEMMLRVILSMLTRLSQAGHARSYSKRAENCAPTVPDSPCRWLPITTAYPARVKCEVWIAHKRAADPRVNGACIGTDATACSSLSMYVHYSRQVQFPLGHFQLLLPSKITTIRSSQACDAIKSSRTSPSYDPHIDTNRPSSSSPSI
ncbi:hypothetical protein J3F83DRAFT_320518 [Trichoderma novae-zelandiae]